jgi:hypothetical protein
MLVFPSFVGGWIAVQSGFATLSFGNAHQVLEKRSKPVCIIPRVRVSSSQSSLAKPPRQLCNPPRTCFCMQVWGYDMPTSTHLGTPILLTLFFSSAHTLGTMYDSSLGV